MNKLEHDEDDLKAAEKLWQLLDDISTLGDSMKPEQNAYFKRVNQIVEKRHEFLTSDGYTLTHARSRPEPGGEFRDIPEHEHTASLYVHCLDCQTFGINTPTRFIDAAECGNCKSIHTNKYYPSCCILADRITSSRGNG